MIDLLPAYLSAVVATAVLLAAVIATLLELRRRSRNFLEQEARLPDACRLLTVREDVRQLEVNRKQLLAEAEHAKSLLLREKGAKIWLDEHLVTYEKASRAFPALLAEIELAEARRSQCVQERNVAEKECAAIKAEHQELTLRVAPLRRSFDQKREIEEWLATHQPTYHRLLEALPVLTAQLAALEEKIEASRQLLSEAESGQRQAEAERTWVIAENQRLNEIVQSQLSESRRLNEQIGELQARQAGLLVELEQLRLRKEQAETNCLAIELQTEHEKTLLKRLREQLQDLEGERAAKLEMVQMLDRLTKKLTADKQQLEDEIENSKIRLQAELDQINQLIQGAMQRWSQIAPTIGADDENRLKELWTPVLKKEQFAVQATDDEQTSLEKAARYLADAGLRFDRRVINAFHTSLKVCEMSPLVVLAGISGTGKSELPRRYAEGIGMHGLTLAVQPRWDSPQDMFGFYNYLENRYRATELSRALVQMDRFFASPERGWNYPEEWKKENLGDRMLLVLLDEMNLARVEYYFSEFLSRLETRRGIDRDKVHERRKAEIMLEVGMQSLHSDNGSVNVVRQPTLPLFVDTNVLFVGTMNEDESTQTLSDKVVDRANVLRFGRPAKLESRLNGTVPSPSTAWLPYAQWKSWIRQDDTLPATVREEVGEWGQTLNQAMHSIGRPFAHRAFASMVSYVANYPEPESYKLAVADQIELKLLPKFRGLDPHDNAVKDALSTVQRIVGQLGDEQLLKAIGESLKNTDHQFVWQGIDRLDQS